MGATEGPAAGLGVLLIAQVGAIVLVVVAFAYAVLAVMAALGLTSFSVLSRFRRRNEEGPDEGGIDDLF
jgi:hypothetical protein